MGNIITIIILLVIVFLAIFSIYKNKRDGKSSCGCDCGSCALKGKCCKQ